MSKCESCGTETTRLNWKTSDPRWLCGPCFNGAVVISPQFFFRGGAPTPSYATASKASHLGSWGSGGERID